LLELGEIFLTIVTASVASVNEYRASGFDRGVDVRRRDAHSGLVGSFHQGGVRGEGPEFRVTEASRGTAPTPRAGAELQPRATPRMGTTPNNGNDEKDDYPDARPW
jgi:hypothetical protein